MRKYIFFSLSIILLFLCLLVWQFAVFSDQKLHIIFCDVGQGDAILITTPSGKQIIVDGGPDESVLSCLSDHMPFWDRKIELMILSHPHADHLNGLIEVLDHYTIDHFATEPLANDTTGYKELLRKVKIENWKLKILLAGDTIHIGDGVVLHVLGPTEDYLKRTSPGGMVGESAEFGSIISMISYGDFDLLLDGDSQVAGLNDALQGQSLQKIDVLQVPHHGSRFGLDKELVEQIDPKLAVISVGKNNYGHPAPAILTLLQNAGIKYLRTDEDGNVDIVSNGKTFWLYH
ncbi:MAG: MBL fold metallo-hydrolase [Candidatus Levybacteria bacterium]|nr:MBL fold metallo-hydrolase [Candidatus Levybacteria bacterium]